MTFDLHQKNRGSSSYHNASTYEVWNLSKLPTLRYRVNKVFSIRPPVTPDDL
ncbi:hypothetical protein HOLleu_05182 [Holothuria leucospilota]|uniref:Uncharacterized protein n=1 Tax=Holothuria leucospilota TaxID=206669 RepID=A0A9Q1CKD1_HOLLE|nr:hypothetical protein HOLleu_05182 [Holothuria leucospilota]